MIFMYLKLTNRVRPGQSYMYMYIHVHWTVKKWQLLVEIVANLILFEYAAMLGTVDYSKKWCSSQIHKYNTYNVYVYVHACVYAMIVKLIAWKTMSILLTSCIN